MQHPFCLKGAKIMKSVSEYRDEVGALAETPASRKRILDFQKRRDARLKKRGLVLVKNKFDFFRTDDDDDNENDNKGKSHGNTKLPFGLCKRFGIEVGADWTPRDAWDALAGKGITAEGAYERLKEGKDPGTPEESEKSESVEPAKVEPKAPPKKTVDIGGKEYELTGGAHERVHFGYEGPKAWTIMGVDKDGGEEKHIKGFGSKLEMLRYLKEQGVTEFPDPETGEILYPTEMDIPPAGKATISGGADAFGAEYGDLCGRYYSWRDRPWGFEAKKIEGTETPGLTARSSMSKFFTTKEDLLYYLKEQGVEEFIDPISGEALNPQTEDLPERFIIGDYGTGYKSIVVGLRGGRYTLMGEQLDGKKVKIADYASIDRVRDWIEDKGADFSKVKLSPTVKKREKERTAWLGSDKVEYVTIDSKRYGDLEASKSYDGWWLSGSAESGKPMSMRFASKVEMMNYLQGQGVQRAKIGDDYENPQEFKVPETKATYHGRPYQDIGLKVRRGGEVVIYGVDLDGEEQVIDRKGYGTDTVQEFLDKVKSNGVSEDMLTMTPETREELEGLKKADEERLRRKREFESKAVTMGYSRYLEPHIFKDTDGTYIIKGYGKDGKIDTVSGWGDMYDMDEYAKQYGVNIESLLKDEEVKRDYEEYKKKREEFDKKAIDIGGGKYADLGLDYDESSGFYKVFGKDARGRNVRIIATKDWQGMAGELERYGVSDDSIPMSEEAQKRKQKALKAKELIDTGKWYSMGGRDVAYTDLKVQKASDTGDWLVIGKDMDGEEKGIGLPHDSWDEAISEMEKHGVSDYKVLEGDREIGKPKWGMHSVLLMRKPEGGFVVFADSKKFGKRAVMFEDPKEENARAWLEKNGIPSSAVRTRGMNPNDDVPRPHKEKSLDSFDEHRAKAADNFDILKDMDEPTKKETAAMLTDLFKDGAYRMRRKGHFEDIVEGRFKTLLETGTSGGATSKEVRRITGERTFGHEHDIKAKDAEKYGYLGVEDDDEAFDSDIAKWYGETVYKFKKDRVKDRVTYSFGDTLDADRPLAGYAGEHPTIEGVSGMDYYGDARWRLNQALESYRRYKRGDIDYSDMMSTVSGLCKDGYVECHFHGDLTIDDVESITFPKSLFARTFDGMTEERRKNILTRLKSRGILLQYSDRSGIMDGYEYLEKKYGGSA